jgi:protein-S-isoprenylcysteine O-methyltransferase Ste14
MHRVPAPAPLALAIAAGGGLVFVGSLLYFLAAYLFLFAAAPSGAAAWPAVLADVGLFTAFALHHSIFARAGVKDRMRRAVPATLERSAYVWIASVSFIAVCALWRPVPGVLWDVEGAARLAMSAGQLVAGAFTLVAARRLDVLDLAGVRQVLQSTRAVHGLDDTGPYRVVRHPIYLAWMAFVWLAPEMTGTRLVFAVVSSFYLVVAIPLEERDLRRSFGEAYASYAARVRWRVLPFVY